MNIFYYIIGAIILVVILFVLSVVIGDGFRTWNEGKNYDDSKKIKGKTILIGFYIVSIFMLILYKCTS